MEFLVLLEPKELAVDPLCSLEILQLILVLLVKLNIVSFVIILEQ